MPGRQPRSMGLAARIRAAMAWADLPQKPLAKQMGVSVTTINRWMTGPTTEGYKRPSDQQLDEIAKLCGVPPAFLQRGFDGLDPRADGDLRIRALERGLDRLNDAFEAYVNRTRAERAGFEDHFRLLDEVVESQLGIVLSPRSATAPTPAPSADRPQEGLRRARPRRSERRT